MLRLGSLCTGYGGLDLAIERVWPTRLAFTADPAPSAAAIIAHHWPGVPNLGDITTVDWATAPTVDILAGGTPCQDISLAGTRAGMTDTTRSGLWAHMRRAIDALRPRLVIWENVPGALSAHAASDMGPCPGCMGDRPDDPMRALGRVLGDLATLGFDAEWRSVRASDVGACHIRRRLFVLAWRRATTDPDRHDEAESVSVARGHSQTRPSHHGPDAADPDGESGDEGRVAGPDTPHGPRDVPRRRDRAPLGVLPTPTSTMPAWQTWGDVRIEGLPSIVEALPTPRASDGEKGGPGQRDSGGTPSLSAIAAEAGDMPLSPAVAMGPDTADFWGGTRHLDAILRHERVLGRVAPPPVAATTRGAMRLNPRFVEWMMMLPEGWVTDVTGLSRRAQLQALGNGVVPAQAEFALRDMAVSAADCHRMPPLAPSRAGCEEMSTPTSVRPSERHTGPLSPTGFGLRRGIDA